MLRLASKSKFAQSQYKRRFILVGTEKEIAPLRQELQHRADDGIEIVGRD